MKCGRIPHSRIDLSPGTYSILSNELSRFGAILNCANLRSLIGLIIGHASCIFLASFWPSRRAWKMPHSMVLKIHVFAVQSWNLLQTRTRRSTPLWLALMRLTAPFFEACTTFLWFEKKSSQRHVPSLALLIVLCTSRTADVTPPTPHQGASPPSRSIGTTVQPQAISLQNPSIPIMHLWNGGPNFVRIPWPPVKLTTTTRLSWPRTTECHSGDGPAVKQGVTSSQGVPSWSLHARISTLATNSTNWPSDLIPRKRTEDLPATSLEHVIIPFSFTTWSGPATGSSKS